MESGIAADVKGLSWDMQGRGKVARDEGTIRVAFESRRGADDGLELRV